MSIKIKLDKTGQKVESGTQDEQREIQKSRTIVSSCDYSRRGMVIRVCARHSNRNAGSQQSRSIEDDKRCFGNRLPTGQCSSDGRDRHQRRKTSDSAETSRIGSLQLLAATPLKRREIVRRLEALGFKNVGGANHDKFQHDDGRWTEVGRHSVVTATNVRNILSQIQVPSKVFFAHKVNKADSVTESAKSSILTISGEEFVENPVKGYTLRCLSHDVAQLQQDGAVCLSDTFFDLNEQARQKALDRIKTMERKASPFKIRQKVKDFAKRKLNEAFDVPTDEKGNAQPHKFNWVPDEIREGGTYAPRHEQTDWCEIYGSDKGPDGVTLGSYASASGKSGDETRFPLPRSPENNKSVFVPNGYIGQVRAQGKTSTIVDFGNTPGQINGLYHFQNSDCRQLKPPEQRVKPIDRAGSLDKSAAGLPDLKGLPEQLAEDIANTLLDTTPNLVSSTVIPELSAIIRDADINTLSIEPFVTEDFLKKPEATELFKSTLVKLVPQFPPSGHGYVAFFSSNNGKPYIFISLIEVIKKAKLNKTTLGHELLLALSHELTHAADWAYQTAGAVQSGHVNDWTSKTELGGLKRLPGEEMNLDSELLAYADTVARVLNERTNGQAAHMSGKELEDTIQELYGEKILNHVKEKNRPDFYRRVVKRINELNEESINRIARLRPGDIPGESVIIVLPVPTEIAKMYPERELDKSPPHITLCYLEHVADEDIEKVENIVAQVVSQANLIHIKFNEGLDEFISKGENAKEQRVLHKSMKSNDDSLLQLQSQLQSTLKSEGFNVKAYPGGFKAHSTVAYVSDDSAYNGAVPEGEWSADHVEIWGTGEHTPELQLKTGSIVLPVQHRTAHLVKRDGKWALVSKSDSSKVLKWFTAIKPSDEAVLHEERRVQYFKHKGAA